MSATVRSQPVLTHAAAAGMIAAAMDHARANGWAVAVAVLDPSGHVIASGRMDTVPAVILDIALDKAFTATLGKSSRAYFERMSSDPGLEMGAANRPRFCAWEGGEPVMVEGNLVAAVGVSGAAGPEDVACARAAISSLRLDG